MSKIIFRKGYKYQLGEDYVHPLPTWFLGFKAINHPFYAIQHNNGNPRLVIRHGYAWDGASGPAIDTPNFMRGCLVHDVFYQMLREGTLPSHIHYGVRDFDVRLFADQALREICREDGMSTIRSSWVYWAVRKFSAKYADPRTKPKPWFQAP